MFYEDILVPIPAKKRITKYGSHRRSYVYEILQRKDKEHPKEVVCCVGLAVNDTEMHPNEKYYDLHRENRKEKPLEEPGIFDSQISIGAPMVLRTTAGRLGITGLLEKCFPGYSEIIQTLLEYYMTERESAAQLYKYYLRDHYTELNYIPSETFLSQLITERIDHEKITQFKNEWMEMRLEGAANRWVDIDFDSTNFNVSSVGVESAERGKAKVDEGLPQVNVAYFLERETGLPVYYDIYYGSIVDMEHCKTAIRKLKEIQKDVRASFVLDRGYFSQANLNYISENGYHFLCMGKETKEYRTMIRKHPVTSIMKAENRIYGNIYGIKQYGRVIEGSEKEYHIYLYYDLTRIATELQERQDWIELGCRQVVGKRDRNHGIRNTYGKYIDLEIDENDVILSAEPNYKYLDDYRDMCGYFWIVSNEDMTVREALQCYRHRTPIERIFRTIKTEADLNKMYASSDYAFEAKGFLAFLTAILRADMTLRLRPYFIQYTNETTQTVLKELEKVKAEKLTDKYVLRYELTNRQKQIFSFYDMRKDDALHYVDKINTTFSLIDEGART